MTTYIIKWFGPYSDEAIEDLDFNFGLYLITGYQKAKRTEEIQYCGISEKQLSKRLEKHHKKDLVTRERNYWFGQIVSSQTLQRADLELIESLIIYFWQPKLNEAKKRNAPKPTVIINRWYDTKFKLRKRTTHIAQTLDDVIFWDGEDWHLGNLKVY